MSRNLRVHPAATAGPFTTEIIDKPFTPDAHTGTNLMRTAMRLLALGAPVTAEQLTAAAGVSAADSATALAAADIEYDDNRILSWGPHNPTNFGRILADYGGVFVAGSLA
jgi:alkylmercury lyase